MVVAKEGGVRGFFLAVQRIERGAVDEVDVEPAVVVVVDQAHAGAVGLDDEILLRRAHFVGPAGESGGLGDVLKDDRSGVDESARRDGALLFVIDRGGADTSGNSAHSALLRLRGRRRRLLSLEISREQKSPGQNSARQGSANQRTHTQRRLNPHGLKCIVPGRRAGVLLERVVGRRGRHAGLPRS